MPKRAGAASHLPLVIALIAAAAAAWYAWRSSAEAAGLDFYQFRAGARVARAETTINLYSSLTRRSAFEQLFANAANESPLLLEVARSRTEYEFYSTPFLYTTFGVFRGSYERDLFAFRVISLMAFIGGVLLCARAAGMGWTAALFLLAFTMTLFQPLKSEMRVTNVNALQLAAVGGAMLLARGASRGRWFAGGAVLGMLVALKPNVAVVVPLLLLYRWMQRDRARLLIDGAGIAAGGLAAFAISSIYFRSARAWLQWLDAARELAATVLPLDAGNIAPALPLLPMLGERLTLVLTALLCAIAAAALYRARDREEASLAMGLGLLIYILAATLVWFHYLILVLPVVIVLLVDRSAIRRALAVLALTLIGADLWTTLVRVQTLQGEAMVVWIGLALLFATAMWRLTAEGVRQR